MGRGIAGCRFICWGKVLIFEGTALGFRGKLLNFKVSGLGEEMLRFSVEILRARGYSLRFRDGLEFREAVSGFRVKVLRLRVI